jgi:hypothetical protein
VFVLAREMAGPGGAETEAGFFVEDFKFIRYLGASADLRDTRADLMNFRDANLGQPVFWRTTLKIRVSGRKAGRLAQQLFAAQIEANSPTN